METIADISSGVGFPKHRQGLRSGEFPFAKVSDITRAVVDSDGALSGAVNYINEDDLASLRAKPIPTGSTVFAKIGEALHLNRRARTTIPVILDNNCMALTPHTSKVLPDFLYRFMATVSLSPFAVATAVPSVRKTDVAQIEVPLPPLAEQQQIVAKLDALLRRSKNARAELIRIPRLTERYKQAILAAAFKGKLTSEWRTRNGLTMNGNWKHKKLGDVSVDVRYGTAAKCHYEPKKIPVLRIPNVVSGGIDTGDLKFGTFTKKDVEKLSLRAGDLLVIRSNGSLDLVGRAALVPQKVEGYLYAGYLIRIRLNPKEVHPAFVQYAFDEPSIRGHIEGLAKSTSGVKNINSEQLKDIRIAIPPIQEQKEIAGKIQAAFSAIDSAHKEASRANLLLDRLERATLCNAFQGQLVT